MTPAVVRLFSILSYAKVQQPHLNIGSIIFNALYDAPPIEKISDDDLVEAIEQLINRLEKAKVG